MAPTRPVPQVYSVVEVADFLGVHEQTVRNLIRSHKLGKVQAGRKAKIHITEAQLAAYLDAYTVDPGVLMSREKAKGDLFEREVARVFREHGHPHAERALRLGAHADHGDIAGVPGFHIECKNQGRIELGAWLHLATIEAWRIHSRPVPLLVVKRRMQPTERAYTVLELATFADLIADPVAAEVQP